MSSVIPAARVKFGMYPVFPAAVFRVCEKIRSENRFSATSASYFRLHLCVNDFYFICLFRVCFVDYFAVFIRLCSVPKACNSHFVSLFYLLPEASGNRNFPATPFSHIRFRSFCTFFQLFFLHHEKLHKISENCRTAGVLPVFIPMTTVMIG